MIIPNSKIKITDEQEANLRNHAEYLVKGELKADFNMKHFSSYKALDDHYPTCGTSGCSLGHGPFSTGIMKDPEEAWTDYGVRIFGIDTTWVGDGAVNWEWLFDQGWDDIDPSPTAAGYRILYFLQFGVPDFEKLKNTKYDDMHDVLDGHSDIFSTKCSVDALKEAIESNTPIVLV